MDLAMLIGVYAHVPGMLLVLARLGGLFVTAPVMGGGYVPNRVKAVISVGGALIIYPVLNLPIYRVDGALALLVAMELGVGLCFGWLLSLFTAGVQMAGELINRYAGFTAAENFDPETDVGAGPVADALYLGTLVLLLSLNLHHHAIAAIAKSYALLPPGGAAMTPALLATVSEASRYMWQAACALSFPVLTVIMAITLAEGIITRAIPQINVLHMSFTVKIVVSLLVLVAALPAMVAFIEILLAAMMGTGLAGLRAMSG